MSAERAVVVHASAEDLAEATAARLLLAILDAQSLRHPVHIAVTGGTIGIKTLERVRTSALRGAVDWTGVHVWWGDERLVRAGDAERNDGQAREALFDHLPIPPENVHPMPSSDDVSSPAEGAAVYAAELARWADDGEQVPPFDVVLLGMGPDAHIASLFPGHATIDVTDRATVGVTNSPKPPSERVSLTLPAITSARQVWLVVSGAEKADAVARALAGADPHEAPVAAARGRELTLWLVDAAAAATHRTEE